MDNLVYEALLMELQLINLDALNMWVRMRNRSSIETLPQNRSLKRQIDLAHISHIVFPMDSLIVCDSSDKIFLCASEFIWLPLSVTSVESTEPGPEAAMHAAITGPPPRCFTGETTCSALSLSYFVFVWAFRGDERLAVCCLSLYFSTNGELWLFHHQNLKASWD